MPRVRATLDLWVLAYILGRGSATDEEILEFAKSLPSDALLLPEDISRAGDIIRYYELSGYLERRGNEVRTVPGRIPAPLLRAAQRLARHSAEHMGRKK